MSDLEQEERLLGSIEFGGPTEFAAPTLSRRLDSVAEDEELDEPPAISPGLATSPQCNPDAITQTSFEDDGILHTDTDFAQQGDPSPAIEDSPAHGQKTATTAQEPQNPAQTLHVLRHLLSVERQCSEQRRRNTSSLQKYLKELQTDYLRQQRDLIDALELGHKIKAQKDAQIETMNTTIEEKDKLIDQLRAQIDNLDEPKLRAEFRAAQDKQSELSKLEQQQLKDQIVSIEQQLVRERICHSQTLQQAQQKISDRSQLHDIETTRLREKIEGLEKELGRLMSEPQNLVVKTLREEKFHMLNELDETKMMLDESRSKYELLKRRLESLQSDHKLMEQRNQEEIDRIQVLCDEQRKIASGFGLELEDKREMIEIMQYNLQKSEKRSKNLLEALRGKEIAYKEIVNQLQFKNDKLVERTSAELKVLEQSLMEKSRQLDKKHNELKRLELEHANKLESLRHDRDQRISKLTSDKQQVEKAMESIEASLSRSIEENKARTKFIDQLKSDLDKIKQDNKNLSIELTRCHAKLLSKQQELEKTSGVYEEIGVKETDQVFSQYDLDEAKKYSKRLEALVDQYKKENEKLSLKLRLSESNLVRLNATITKEQARMYRECEKKLRQILSDQCNYNKYKSRYRKYGNKLKGYYQHLHQVHSHFCTTATCGSLAWDSSSQDSTNRISARDSEDTKSVHEYSLISLE